MKKIIYNTTGVKIILICCAVLTCFSFSMPQTSAPIDVTELTITQIHEFYKSGKFNCQQLVGAYIERINKFNKQINAITSVNQEAMAIAKSLDEEYKRTKKLRPLHGIPIIVKDNINTKGMTTTAGAIALQNFYPNTDAFVIDKLIKAGAIVIAKSNMAEWAFTPWGSFSSTHGATLNPYNVNYTPAGSSGGTGAAVAANLGAVGLGTDTGNSIRGPSSHNALVGFRTTLGLISREGIVPLYLVNDVVGPMCRTVEDATKVLEVMVGIDAKDPITKHSEGKIPVHYLPFLKKNGLKGARIGVLRTLSDANPDPEIKALFEKSLIDMKKLGAQIIDPVVIPDFDTLRKNQWCQTFKTDVESFLAKYVKNDTIKTLEDIIRIGSKSKSASDRLVLLRSSDAVINNCGDTYTAPRRIAYRKAIEDEMDRLKLDAIVYPTWNNKPAQIDASYKDYKGDNSQIISPHTGQPAFTVPMGFSNGNLPAGIQFLGRMFAEPTLIKLVYSYEQGTKHRVPPLLK